MGVCTRTHGYNTLAGTGTGRCSGTHGSTRATAYKRLYADAGLFVCRHADGTLIIMISDGHGNPDPCGIAGTGVTGTGMGEKKVTRDVPVPVLVGHGSVLRVTQYLCEYTIDYPVILQHIIY